MKIIILIVMIFCHIVDDFYLQGVLANLKQKSWWDKNATDSMYRHDYIAALIIHSFSWSFMMMLPILFYIMWWNRSSELLSLYFVLFIINAVLHAFVDNEKSNNKSINLVVDQLCHLAQIVITWWMFII